MDIALEIGQGDEPLRLAQQGLLTPMLDDAPLMRHDGAEMTAAEAAPLADETELDLGDGGHAARLVVYGMPCIAIRQFVDLIHLFRRQGQRRRILHDADLFVLLDEPAPAQGVLLQIFDAEGVGKLRLVLRDRRIGQQFHIVPYIVAVRHAVAGAAHILHVLDRDARMKFGCNFDDLFLSHAVDQEIGTAL